MMMMMMMMIDVFISKWSGKEFKGPKYLNTCSAFYLDATQCK